MSAEVVTISFLPPHGVDGQQLIGKFGPGEQPVYQLRKKFQETGRKVLFPWGDSPIGHFRGYTFSDRIEEYVPFDTMQDLVFSAIEKNPVNIVCNNALNDDGSERVGYIGFSSAHEIAYGMLHKKPTVLTSPIYGEPDISKYVPQELFDILMTNVDCFFVKDLLKMQPEEIDAYLQGLPETVDYKLNEEQEQIIQRECRKLLRIEHYRWKDWRRQVHKDFKEGKRPDDIFDPSEELDRLYEEPYAAYMPLEEWLQLEELKD